MLFPDVGLSPDLPAKDVDVDRYRYRCKLLIQLQPNLYSGVVHAELLRLFFIVVVESFAKRFRRGRGSRFWRYYVSVAIDIRLLILLTSGIVDCCCTGSSAMMLPDVCIIGS